MGVRRLFVNESVKNGKQGDICVVAMFSPRTAQLASAIVSGDLSRAPKGKPGKPLSRQIKDWETAEGVRQLMTTYGTEMLRDQDGVFHLVSYAQAGPATTSRTSINIAFKIAQLQALAEIATVARENTKLKEGLDNAENTSELKDGTIDYESPSAYQEDLESVTSMEIQGAKQIGRWAAKHPVTGQPVAGVIMA